MNRTALTNIAPDIFRKRLLVEGYFQSDMAESVLRDYFRHKDRAVATVRDFFKLAEHQAAIF